MIWTHALAAALPAFLASLVEFVEAPKPTEDHATLMTG